MHVGFNRMYSQKIFFCIRVLYANTVTYTDKNEKTLLKINEQRSRDAAAKKELIQVE